MPDKNLNYQSGKKIIPFTFEGAAIFADNGDVVMRSGAFHYTFDQDWNLKQALRSAKKIPTSKLLSSFKSEKEIRG